MENRQMKNFMKWHKRGEAKAKVKKVRVPSLRLTMIFNNMFEGIILAMYVLKKKRQLKQYNKLTKESNELIEELSNESN